jgi:hypothetical protein
MYEILALVVSVFMVIEKINQVCAAYITFYPRWDKALNSLMFYKLHIEIKLQYLQIMDLSVRIFRK